MSLDLGTLVGKLELDGDKFDAALDKLPDALKGKSALLAGAAGVAATGITLALAKGIDTGLDMQDAGNKAMAELGLTQAQSAQIGKMAGSLYSQAYGDSIDGVSDAITDVISSIGGMRNASDTAVEAMTAKVLNFNSAFGIDTARTTQIVGQLLKGGLVKDADEAMDLLTASMQKVPKAVREDIMDAADEYSPFFKQLGFSGNEMFSTLVEGAAKGQFGIDKAGDAIKEFSIRATDLSDTNAQQALKDLGLSGTDMADDLLAGGDRAFSATQKIISGLEGISDPGKQALDSTYLFGTQLEDLNKGQIKDFLGSLDGTSNAMGKTAGAADKMGAAVNGGARTGWTELTRTFETTVGVIGQQLAPMLTDLIGWLNDNPAIMQAVVFAVLGLSAAFVVLTAAMWAMSLTPIALTIGAIVLGVALLAAGVIYLVTHWSEVVAWLQGVGGAVWGWLQGVIQGFVDWWNGIWSGFGTVISDAWNGIIAWLTSLPATMLAGLTALGQGILTGLAALPGLLYQGLVTGLALVLAGLYAFFVLLPVQIVGWLISAGTWLLQTGQDLLNGFKAGIDAGWQATVAFFAALPGRIVSFVVGFAALLISWGSALLAGLTSGITSGAAAVWSFMSSLPGRIVGFLTSLPGLLISGGTALLRGLATGATSGASAVWSFISGLPGQIMAKAGSFASTLVGAGGDLMSGLLRGIRGGLSSILGAIAGMAGDIMDKFKSILGIHSPSTVFAGFGLNIGQGLINGLADIQGDVDASVASLVTIPKSSVQLGLDARGVAGASGGLGLGGGPTVDARMYVDRAGWTREELEQEQSDRIRNNMSLVGLDDVVGVA